MNLSNKQVQVLAEEIVIQMRPVQKKQLDKMTPALRASILADLKKTKD